MSVLHHHDHKSWFTWSLSILFSLWSPLYFLLKTSHSPSKLTDPLSCEPRTPPHHLGCSSSFNYYLVLVKIGPYMQILIRMTFLSRNLHLMSHTKFKPLHVWMKCVPLFCSLISLTWVKSTHYACYNLIACFLLQQKPLKEEHLHPLCQGRAYN